MRAQVTASAGLFPGASFDSTTLQQLVYAEPGTVVEIRGPVRGEFTPVEVVRGTFMRFAALTQSDLVAKQGRGVTVKKADGTVTVAQRAAATAPQGVRWIQSRALMLLPEPVAPFIPPPAKPSVWIAATIGVAGVTVAGILGSAAYGRS